MNEELDTEQDIEVITPQVVTSSAVEQVERSALITMMQFARMYPRSITDFKREALTHATETEDIAATMYYSLPRAGKTIEGPSVRLAEIVASAWQHLHAVARDMEVEDRVVRAQAVAWDIQRNIRIGIEATRRIIDKNGNRFNEDMIQTTMAAARAIAFRNSVFKVVPAVYTRDLFAQCKLTAIGKGLTMEQRRTRVLKAYSEDFHKTEKEVLAVARRKAVADLTADDIVMLHGLKTALKDGDTTWDQILGERGGTVVDGMTMEEIAGGEVTSGPAKERKKR